VRRPLQIRSAMVAVALVATVATPAVAVPESPGPARRTSDSGLRLDRIDRTVSPGADFYRFANGRWHDGYTFRADETYAGARPDLIALRKARIRSIIDSAAAGELNSPVGAVVGALYASYLDTARVDAAGLVPAASDLDRIRRLRTRQDLLDLFADAPANGLPSAIAASVFYDFSAPGRLRYRVAPGGLGLQERELYLDGGKTAVDARAAYRAYAADMLRLLGERDAYAKADRVLALETRLATLAWPTARARDPLKTNNPMPRSTLDSLAPGIDWTRFMARAGVVDADIVIVEQPDAMAPLAAEIAATPIADWRLWAMIQYFNINAPYLAARFADRHFAMFDRVLGGQREPAPRWQRGTELVERFFSDALGQLYVERHFAPGTREAVEGMVASIRSVMRDRIVAANWMSQTTRAEALRKIDTINVKIGHPAVWPDFAGADFRRDDLFGNLRKARQRAWRDRAALVAGPLPRDRWMTSAQTSGAAANPNLNEITIPAGALEPPYFTKDADPAVNYGAIGAVIGHELSHLFDQLGRQMDATGKLRDWWAPEDARRYEAVAGRIVAQYDGLRLGPDMTVNGRITQNENIADVAGLQIAFEAWRRSLGGSPAPVIDGFSGEQRFFLAWAQMRAGKMTEATLRRQLATGPHAPDEVRGTQPLRNVDAWYEAFGIGPKDPLYLPPESRARFW